MTGGGCNPKCKFCITGEPSLGALAMLISAFRKSDEYSICITIITMEYEITNNVH